MPSSVFLNRSPSQYIKNRRRCQRQERQIQTELVFTITAREQCGGETYLSTEPSRARVTRQGSDRWLLEWEDWADGDFNDSVVLLEVE